MTENSIHIGLNQSIYWLMWLKSPEACLALSNTWCSSSNDVWRSLVPLCSSLYFNPWCPIPFTPGSFKFSPHGCKIAQILPPPYPGKDRGSHWGTSREERGSCFFLEGHSTPWHWPNELSISEPIPGNKGWAVLIGLSQLGQPLELDLELIPPKSCGWECRRVIFQTTFGDIVLQ